VHRSNSDQFACNETLTTMISCASTRGAVMCGIDAAATAAEGVRCGGCCALPPAAGVLSKQAGMSVTCKHHCRLTATNVAPVVA
jgi:hypothetical protein